MRRLNEYCMQVSSIDEYLNTNVDIRKVKSIIPENPTKEELMEFLDEQHFTRVYVDSLAKFYRELSKTKIPIYWSLDGDNRTWVRFGNGGRGEPWFFWRTKKLPSKFLGSMWSECWFNKEDIVFDTFDKFKKRICEYFKWT